MRRTLLVQWLLSLSAFFALLVLGSFLFWVWQYPEAITGTLTLPERRHAVVSGDDVQITLTTNGGYVGDARLFVNGDTTAASFSTTSHPWRTTADWRAPRTTGPYTLTVRFETLAGAMVESEPLLVDVVPGGRIAYVQETTNAASALYVVQTDGSDRRLWTRDAGVPSWGPDGALYFLRNGAVLRQTAPDAAPEVFHESDTEVVSFAWGPYLALVDVDRRLFLRNDDGALTHLPFASGTPSDVAWTPSGDALIVVAEHGGNVDLFRLSPSDGEITRLTTDAAKEWDPAWRPGYDETLFTSDREGVPQIFWKSFDPQTNTSIVTRASNGARHASWNPTGEWFTYSAERGDSAGRHAILLQRLRTEDRGVEHYAVQIVRSDEPIRHPVWYATDQSHLDATRGQTLQ